MKLDKLIDTLDSDEFNPQRLWFYNPYMVITANTVDGGLLKFLWLEIG